MCGSNGRKAVPLALMGANVTVFDISEGNKKYAMALAKAADVEIEYVVTDLYDIDLNTYGEQFDFLYLEGGILHYFHDIDRLMTILFALLKKGGKMILNDFHPFRKILSVIPSQAVTGDYFDTSIIESDVAYKSFLQVAEGEEVPNCKLRLYSLSEIINAVIESGFIVREFQEHPNYFNSKVPGDFTIYASK